MLPAYRTFHQDLLAHQDDAILFGPLFVGRVYEAVIQCLHRDSTPLDEDADCQAFVDEVLRQLNDYVGYRPVAVLETEQKLEPYPHERCRPIPVYIRGVGVACGPYEQLIARTIAILAATNPTLLEQAYFDLARLAELAIDPRPYDFDHPANKRPNYQFGTWDLQLIDEEGYYCRFVIQQVSLDALARRIQEAQDAAAEDLLLESAAALAGTILMASGVCGRGPDTHSSEISLGNLLPRIATYRDAFYEQLLVDHPSERLIAEAKHLRQPFGGVRQYLNAELSRQRARQLEQTYLARLYARMGYAAASAREVAAVPTPSARIVCQIHCDLTEAHQQLDSGQTAAAAGRLPTIAELLERGIQCGAIVDPWNILGFGANFSLFPTLENTVHDHRVDELNTMMDEIFALQGRTWCRAAAARDRATEEEVAGQFRQLAQWWDQFAADAVSGIEGVAAEPLYQAAASAAQALAAWHEAGTKAGDIAFWQPHVADFESPKAYILVLNALIDQKDFVASMGVLMHWLSRSDEVALHQGEDLFYAVATGWLNELLAVPDSGDPPPSDPAARPPAGKSDAAGPAEAPANDWTLVQKFFDFLEANAGEYWDVPDFELSTAFSELSTSRPSADEGDPEYREEEQEEEAPDGQEELYAAAYDNMVYRDSTDDGIDSELLGEGLSDSDFELDEEARRLTDRLAFLVALARMWKRTALAVLGVSRQLAGQSPHDRLATWLDQLVQNRSRLVTLLNAIAGHQVPLPGDNEVLQMEYDRRRLIKDALLERVVIAYMVSTEAAQFLIAAGVQDDALQDEPELRQTSGLVRAALAGDIPAALQQYQAFLHDFEKLPILYVPLSKGGHAQLTVAIRSRQRTVRLVLELLPRLGLLKETCELLQRCAEAERQRPVGPGAVTEYDQLFRIGYQGMVRCLVASSAAWEPPAKKANPDDREEELIEYLQHLTEMMMVRWLDHSRGVRLSVLERVANEKQWKKVVQFIKRYGQGLFSQLFFNLGNLRAILQMGVEPWLSSLGERAEDERLPLLEVVHEKTTRRAAADQLQLIIEAIIENYTEYRDYNGTTTQSDRGEMLYTLLDMLRLRVTYDRYAWNLMPIGQAHEILVREQREVAAEFWRNEMIRRTSEMADQLWGRLGQLEAEHGMKLTTVSDRIGERFVRPLLVDRVCALVRPSMATAASDGAGSTAFNKFAQQVDELTREPTGVGLDVPDWLEDIEEEVERTRAVRIHSNLVDEVGALVEQCTLTRSQLQDQLDAMEADE
ncbi:MAG: hypothetical protein GTO04_09525 [Planctomycetales bacterium]|nr:hypothetical protein [Planctomycetales bacterium]